MRENKLKGIWQDGGFAINGWLHIPSTWSAEVMAHQGWDSVTIDLQHGQMGYETAVQMLQALSTTDVTPMVRVNWNEPGIVMKLLDSGAYGVICPMVNTRAEAEAFVGACRYVPLGYRSMGPTRARIYGGSDYGQHANDTVLSIVMIETAEALNNIDDILSVPGLNALYVGPGDLSLSLHGTAGMDIENTEFLDALDTIVAAANRHNVVAGIHTGSPAYARKMIERGFRFISISSDTSLLSKAASSAVAQVREGQPTQTDSATSSVY